MTCIFQIKLSNLITSVTQSFQSQFLCLISLVSIRVYQGIVQLTYVYYQHRTVTRLVNSQLPTTTKPSTWIKVLNIGLISISRRIHELVYTVGEWHRQFSPVLNAILLSIYMSYQTQELNIRQICRLLQRKFNLSSATGQINGRPRVVGLNFCIKGRTPREPVRPRKTVQRRLIGKQLMNRSNASTLQRNPELGSYSLWMTTSSM